MPVGSRRGLGEPAHTMSLTGLGEPAHTIRGKSRETGREGIAPVPDIAHDRVADVGQMLPELVHPPGDRDQRVGGGARLGQQPVGLLRVQGEVDVVAGGDDGKALQARVQLGPDPGLCGAPAGWRNGSGCCA